jgi:recombination protein RecA
MSGKKDKDSRKLKQAALETALKHLNETYSNVKLSSAEEFEVTEGLTTTYDELDDIIGCKGMPRRRITEIFGPEQSGKTYLALKTVVNALKNGCDRMTDW